MYKKLTKDHIGQIHYPYDNSYSTNVKTGEETKIYLAGTIKTEALPCRIVSYPYLKKIMFGGSLTSFSFIHIEYNGETYEILNIFHKSCESMKEMLGKYMYF